MKKFKAHSQKILQLMINSIYTNKEIFLRELISNASDALDKAKFASLTNSSIDGEFFIKIDIDKDSRTISISDSGIGMDQEELEANLGTIAESGTERFKIENDTDAQFIGHFGVGFYSAFMAAKKVEVLTKKQSSPAYKWQSDASGYSISQAEKQDRGTLITLYLKDNDQDVDYDQFLDEHYISSLIKKYSDYIRYPIYMDLEKSVPKEGSDEWRTSRQKTCINSMTPIWKKSISTDRAEMEDYFLKQYYSTQPPLDILSFNMEGGVSFRALLFIPAVAPFDYYSAEYERGLSLYSNGVMIMQSCKELLPDYLGFVKGIIDSDDISLNISRETLQKDRQLSAIAKSVEKKVLGALEKMLSGDREKYQKLFEAFGASLKFGVYNNFGMRKNELQNLLLFYSSSQKNLVTLKEYVGRMGEGKNILYAAGSDVQSIDCMPIVDTAKDSAEVLYLTDRIDEFVMKIINNYDGKSIKSVFDNDVVFDQESKNQDDEKDLLKSVAECLEGKVAEVRLSYKLKNHPVFLTSGNEISLEMEKVLSGVNKDNKVVAKRVLELNPLSNIFAKLKLCSKDKLKDYCILLYNQALMLAGLNPETADFVDSLNRVLGE